MSKKEINKNFELRMELMDILEWVKKKGKRLNPLDFNIRIADFIQRVKKQARQQGKKELLERIKEEMPKATEYDDPFIAQMVLDDLNKLIKILK